MTRFGEAPPESAGDDPLSRDLPCFSCGYNLRGLPAAGQCPECSTPVSETLRRHAELAAGRLQPITTSDPRWVRTLSRACALIVLAGVLTVAGHSSSLFNRLPLRTAVRIPIFLAPFALFATGAWLGGAREPVFAAGRRRWLIILLRGSTVAWGVCIAALLAGAAGGSGNSIRLWLRGATLVAGVASWSFFWHFREIALRLGRPGLRRASLWLAWGTLGTCAMTLLPHLDGVYIRPHHVHLVTSVPVAGQPMLLALLPFSLVSWPRVEPALAAWGMAATASGAALVVAELFRRALRRAAEDAVGASQPPAGDEPRGA